MQDNLMASSPFVKRMMESVCVSYFSGMVVFLGVLFGCGVVEKCNVHPGSRRANDFLASCAAWDGQWYCEIVDRGYSYQPGKMCNAAFFPGFPCLAALVRYGTGCRTELALLIVANVCAVLNVVLLREYVVHRFPGRDSNFHLSVVMVFCVFPTTMFFRMAYTESLFALTCLIVLYGIERNWSLYWLALIAGVAAATRSVGVSLLLPILFVAWERSNNLTSFIGKVCWVVPLAIWGLVAFVIFQWIYLDEPFAFLKAQKAWEFRVVPPFAVRCWELITLKPIWSTYLSSEASCYWGAAPPSHTPEFNLQFWNPVYWVLSVVVVAIGFRGGLVSRSEALVSVGLLFIPYYLQGPRAGMTSCARYSSVVIPMYIVLAYWIERFPKWGQHVVISSLTIFLFVYASMFSRWYWFF